MLILIIVICVSLILAVVNVSLAAIEKKKIIPNGKLVQVNGHNLHIYAEGNRNDAPIIVFMSGSGTVAPVYDFKPLYRKLSSRFRIAVVEKIGYGYSDIADVNRDIDSMLEETRLALTLAGEKPPYVLAPHSLSGLEALYWAQKYPSEIAGIIGLDMAMPSAYQELNIKASIILIYIIRGLKFLGLHRLLGKLIVSDCELDKQEYKQAKYLGNRNLYNQVCMNEAKNIYRNADKVDDSELPKIKYLLFCSDGKSIGKFWIQCQSDFAKKTGAEIVYLDCGHYIFYYKSDEIAEKISQYISDTLQAQEKGGLYGCTQKGQT